MNPFAGMFVAKQSDKKLLRRLAALDAAINRKFVRKTTRAGAAIVQKVAKKKAPKRSGRLKKQVRVRAMKRKKGRIGHSVVIQAKPGDPQVFAGAFVELGSIHNEAIGFVREAYDETETEVETFMRQDLWRQIAEFAKSWAK